MTSIKIPVISITLLGFLLTNYLALAGATTYAYQQKDSSIMIVGKVFCDTCLEHKLSENGHAISGASIAVECGFNRKMMAVSIIGETDENGDFKVELPSNILQSADQLNNCWVRPRNNRYDSCRIPSTSAPLKLTPQLDSNGALTYSAGPFSYRHETVPPLCYKEDFMRMMRGRTMAENVDQSSKAGQQTPTIPLLPNFPPSTLPSVPPLPKFSIPPLPSVPPLPKFSIPPLPNTHSLPKFSIPPLTSVPPLPKFSIPPLPSTPSLPKFSIPPLPSVPPLPKTPLLPSISPLPSAPPLPKISPLPQFSVPPLPKIPPLPQLSFPPLPNSPPLPQIPQTPQIPNFQFPPTPFLTPPPPSQKNGP